MVFCEILEDGEKALLYKYDGKVKLEEGPKQIWLIRSKLKRLLRFTAQHDEYLQITFNTGLIEHRLGPCNEFLNNLIHASIQVKKCYCLNPNEAIIVYKYTENDQFNRCIEYGPQIYLPKPNEWLHQFSWHGNSEENKTKYQPDKKKFEVLNFAPNQLYYNVDQVRTADDALIRIKVMIFYELKNIEKMLDETKDPVADLINCCSSDVISFTSKRTYLSFIENCNKLNDLSEYNKLKERSEKIGFEVTKVVFRGYFASPMLQAMHDKSIEARTKLKLEYESQLQKNEKTNANLISEIDRLTTEQELELQKLLNFQELEKIKNENNRQFKLREAENKAEICSQLKLKDLEIQINENKQRCDHLEKLIEYNVNPTEYLIMSINQPDKLIRIEKKKTGDTNDSNFSNIHFHQEQA